MTLRGLTKTSFLIAQNQLTELLEFSDINSPVPYFWKADDIVNLISDDDDSSDDDLIFLNPTKKNKKC